MTPAGPLLRPGARVALACLPGTLCDQRAFDPLIGHLRARGLSLRVIALDTAAAGSAVDVARKALEHLAPTEGETLVVAGFSLGGMIAAQLAKLLGDRVGGLLLLDVNGEADKPGNEANRRAMVERARQNGLRRFILDETWPTHVAPSRLGDVALRETVVAMAEAVGIAGFARQAEIAISRPRSIDTLSALSLPTLVVCGAEDRITPPALAADVAAATGGRLLVIADAGHFAILERPDVIADSVMAWLLGSRQPDRVPEAAASGVR